MYKQTAPVHANIYTDTHTYTQTVEGATVSDNFLSASNVARNGEALRRLAQLLILLFDQFLGNELLTLILHVESCWPGL